MTELSTETYILYNKTISGREMSWAKIIGGETSGSETSRSKKSSGETSWVRNVQVQKVRRRNVLVQNLRGQNVHVQNIKGRNVLVQKGKGRRIKYDLYPLFLIVRISRVFRKLPRPNPVATSQGSNCLHRTQERL